MKKIVLILAAAMFWINAFAQEPEEKEEEKENKSTQKGFRKDLLFSGGTVNIGYFNGWSLGATPQLGYSVTKWLDAGVIFGFNYISRSNGFDYKVRQTVMGPGAFARVFPFDFLFATFQFEHNFIRVKEIYSGNSFVTKVNAASLLVGLGYTSGREYRNAPYYYFSLSVDVLNNINSPYRTLGNEVYPVVNAGFNIPLFQGGSRR